MNILFINELFKLSIEELYNLVIEKHPTYSTETGSGKIHTKAELIFHYVKLRKKEGPSLSLKASGVFSLIYKTQKEYYGFLRYHENNFQQSDVDVFLTSNFIDKWNIVTGMFMTIEVELYNKKFQCTKAGPKISAELVKFANHDKLTVMPFKQLNFSLSKESTPIERLTINLLELFCLQGYGQRTMILAPATAGKTTALISIGKALKLDSDSEILVVLLISERPEEITKIREELPHAIVFAASFDEPNKKQIEIVEFFISYIQSLTTKNKNVICLIDSMTRITRAYNNSLSSTGKTMTGGLDPVALEKIKKLFGMARCYQNKDGEMMGSVTIFGTCLSDTGAIADDIIARELRSVSNSEISISLSLSRIGIYPAIDIKQSMTRNFHCFIDDDTVHKLVMIRKNFFELFDNSVYDAYRILHLKIRDQVNRKNLLDLFEI